MVHSANDRTSQKLQDRILEHVPKSIRSCSSSRKTYFLLVGANFPPSLIPCILVLIQPLDFNYYKILPVLNIVMTADFLFLFKAVFLPTYLLLKSVSSKLLTPLSAYKKNSCTHRKDCAQKTLSHWSFFSQSLLGFFL